MSIRVAVIGCGAQGRLHLDTHHAIPDVTIAAVCDADSLRLIAEHHGVPVDRTPYGVGGTS